MWMQSKGKSGKWLYFITIFRMEYLWFGRSRSGVGAGVGVDIFKPESESESLEICRLRSPDVFGYVTSTCPFSTIDPFRVR